MDNEHAMYHGGAFEEAMSFAKNYYSWITEIFKPYLKGTVAEVGAGSGNFSALLLKEDIRELVSIEPSNDMFPLLKARFENEPRVTCVHSYFDQVCAKYRERFDAIVYVNVLEHIEDDEREARLMRDSLKTGGAACIFVPALQWLYSDFEATVGHHRRYHKKPLAALLEKAGLKVERIHYMDSLGVVPWFVAFKLLKGKVNQSNTALYDKTAIPMLKMLESRVHPPFGKNLIAIATKR